MRRSGFGPGGVAPHAQPTRGLCSPQECSSARGPGFVTSGLVPVVTGQACQSARVERKQGRSDPAQPHQQRVRERRVDTAARGVRADANEERTNLAQAAQGPENTTAGATAATSTASSAVPLGCLRARVGWSCDCVNSRLRLAARSESGRWPTSLIFDEAAVEIGAGSPRVCGSEPHARKDRGRSSTPRRTPRTGWWCLRVPSRTAGVTGRPIRSVRIMARATALREQPRLFRWLYGPIRTTPCRRS